ncbi:peptide ABC transporter permease [Bifidobacterium lemurum]|uniref:Peptide ABC transporter permease n=1 Tax=Bifidobacterium lemurum TaxID=1603886 RepID=A0A261FUK5_9BIFI|nr:ABC transporter permease [Bifidobacterium lemurum]OZG62860.1 peptide ABC transporter permease [Bifidobacterium lemurum]QOL35186.1 ABC transporter permease [Bifidobacterium lemurum]
MFVLSNAWSALMRHKGRSAATAAIVLVVVFGTMTAAAIVQANTEATGSTRAEQTANASIRPTAATWEKVSATDSDSTEQYLTWSDYTTFATAAQEAGLSFDFTVTETVPVRATDGITALSGGSIDGEDDDTTGGALIWRAFYTLDAAHANDMGRYKVIEGKHLNYSTSTTDITGALISQAFADENGLEVGDTFEVATATDADTTYELTVRGIYEYVADADVDNPVTAARNRDNAIYTNYPAFSNAGLDPTSTDDVSGWEIPDLDVLFNPGTADSYDSFVTALQDSGELDGYEVSSPSLEAYDASIAPLNSAASTARVVGIALAVAGGAAVLAVCLVGVCARSRRDEIGMALASGVTRGRLGWQFMLEVFIVTLPALAVGILAGGFLAKPLGSALVSYETSVGSSLIWHSIWIGLGVVLAIAIVTALRTVAFTTPQLFAAEASAATDSPTHDVDADTEAQA